MSKVENQYLNVLKQLHAEYTKYDPTHVNNINRTGIPATKEWVTTIRHDFSEGFPLLTTKRVWWRGVVSELIGFLAGVTNHEHFDYIGGSVWKEWALTEDYVSYEMTDPQDRLLALANKLGVGIYEANQRILASIEQFGHDIGTRKIYEDNDIEFERVTTSYERGELGPIYGAIWRDFGGVDQILDLLDNLRSNPMSRRHWVTAWKPDVLPDENQSHADNVLDGKQALPPCHIGTQFDVRLEADGTPLLRSMFLMRSADVFLGVPFNIASYGLLTAVIADELDFQLDESVAVLNNYHLYHNAADAVATQMVREPGPLPKLQIPKEFNLMKVLGCKGKKTQERLDILKEQVDLLVDALVEYHPQGVLKAPVAI